MINNNFNTNYSNSFNNNYTNSYKNNKKEECHTCENRKYKDGSDDAGVSFKNATKVSPNASSFAVRSHELEHVIRERAKAEQDGREVISQTVTIKTSICPECGTPYTSGGETRTITKSSSDESIKKLDDEERRGQFIDMYV